MKLLLMFAVIVGTFTIPNFANASSAAMALPDCLGKPVTEPKEYVFACGDGNASIENVSWW